MRNHVYGVSSLWEIYGIEWVGGRNHLGGGPAVAGGATLGEAVGHVAPGARCATHEHEFRAGGSDLLPPLRGTDFDEFCSLGADAGSVGNDDVDFAGVEPLKVILVPRVARGPVRFVADGEYAGILVDYKEFPVVCGGEGLDCGVPVD